MPKSLIVTTAADYLTATGKTPADKVWWLHGTQDRRRLSEIPYHDPALNAAMNPDCPEQ